MVEVIILQPELINRNKYANMVNIPVDKISINSQLRPRYYLHPNRKPVTEPQGGRDDLPVPR